MMYPLLSLISIHLNSGMKNWREAHYVMSHFDPKILPALLLRRFYKTMMQQPLMFTQCSANAQHVLLGQLEWHRQTSRSLKFQWKRFNWLSLSQKNNCWLMPSISTTMCGFHNGTIKCSHPTLCNLHSVIPRFACFIYSKHGWQIIGTSDDRFNLVTFLRAL